MVSRLVGLELECGEDVVSRLVGEELGRWRLWWRM